MKAVSILNKFDVLAFSMGSPNENHRSSSGLAQFKVQTQKLKKNVFHFCYISGNGITRQKFLSWKMKTKKLTLKKFILFWEMELSSSNLEKSCYISGGNFKAPRKKIKH